MLRTKKMVLIIVSVVILAILSATICLMVVSNKKNDIGEIYFHQTELEHIKSNNDGTMYADNEILLVADETAKYKDIERLAKANGAEIVGWIEQTNDYQLQLNSVCNADELEQIIATFKENDLVDDAYSNYAFAVSGTATKERDGFIYGEKWEGTLQNFNDCKGESWGIEAVNALAAWDVLDSHKSDVHPVKVGLIDGGFDTEHEDLGFAETFYNTSADDHGTHVAGTMAAKANNKEGICGVYPYGDGNLYGVSHSGEFNYSENGDPLMTSMFLKIAYSELILRDVKVINSSLGFNYKDWDPVLQYESPEWYERVNYLESNAYILGDFLSRLLNKGYDFVLINAAGNDSNREGSVIYDSKYSWWTTVIDKENYPDVFDRIIVVGTIVPNGSIRNSSNGGERVDIYAPGGDVYSTVADSKYNTMSGTSMAAPHVSGVAAIVWSLNNNLTGAQVKEIVCGSHNMRYNSCDVVDAYIAAERVASTIGLSENKNPNNGGILCWVVSAKDVETKIENATVTVTNTQTGEKFSTTTDVYGHFELLVPEGKYTLKVQAEGYQSFKLPETIKVESEQVHYLSEWIKMEKRPEALSPNSAVDIYCSQKDVWMAYPEYFPMNGYSYGFLDLDFDGTLELVRNINDGSGRYSSNSYFKINMKNYTVYELKVDAEENNDVDGDGYDYSLTNEFPKLYRRRTDGSFLYYCEDLVRMTTGDYAVYYGTLNLINDCVVSKTLFAEHHQEAGVYNNPSPIDEYSFYDGNNQIEVSKSLFDKKTTSYFDKMEDVKLTWGLIPGYDLETATYAKQKELLLHSYKQFGYSGFSYNKMDLIEPDLQISNDEDLRHVLTNNIWEQDVQSHNEYTFNIDNTFVDVDFPEVMTYSLDGNTLTLFWERGGKTSLQYVTKSDDINWKEDMFFYDTVYSKLGKYEGFFYETDYESDEIGVSNAFWLRIKHEKDS